MANEKVLNTRIQLKYDSYSNWVTNNTALRAGEIAIAYLTTAEAVKPGEEDTQHPVLFKVGPGNFNDLPWASALAADVHSWAKKSESEFTTWVKTLVTVADIDAYSKDEVDAKFTANSTADQKYAKDYADSLAENYDAAGTAQNLINDLDVTDTAVTGKYVSAVSETDGKISVTREDLPTYTLATGSANGTVAFNGEDVAVKGLGSAAYTDSTAYDAAGAASEVNNALEAYKILNDAAVSAADAKAVAAQGEVDALEAYVGTFTASEGIDTVVKYIDAKTANIASDETVSALDERVKAIEDDYLVEVDKTELAGQITAEKERAEGIEAGLQTAIDAINHAETGILKTAKDYVEAQDATLKSNLEGQITAEKSRAEGIEAGLESRLKAVEDDHLVADDKTELEGKIDLKADKTALDAVSAVANAAATQTALQGEVDRAQGEEARIEGLVTAEAERAAQAEAGLQTQINTIMNNPDTEGVINSINEFTQYITEHGEIADGFRTDIDANAKAIADHETLAAQTYETKEDATTKHEELVAMVNEKAVQGDWKQNDETAADYIKNRPFHETDNVFGEVICDATFSEFTYYDNYDYYHSTDVVEHFGVTKGDVYEIILDGETYYSVCSENYYKYLGSKSITDLDPEYPFSIYFSSNLDLNVKTPGPHTLKITHITEPAGVVQIDDKFISDNIARVTDIQNAMEEVQNTIEALPQSDWAQEDVNAPDFIKNKTHYITSDYISIFDSILKFTGSMINVNDATVYSGTYQGGNAGTHPSFVIEAGKTYRVTWNNTQYVLTAEAGEYSNYHILGNTRYTSNADNSDGYRNTNVPFVVHYDSDTKITFVRSHVFSTDGINIKVEEVLDVVHQLDEKFIPDTIARTSDLHALEEKIGDKTVAEAIEACKIDAANKDVVVLAEAQKGIDTVQDNLDTHADNGDIHVTAEKQAVWNAAVQTVTAVADGGLKATRTGNDVTIEIDDTFTFIFDCGGAN